MISDSKYSIFHMHPIEKVLDDKELKQWKSDINHVLPETCLGICNVEKYKDTDDAFEVNVIDSIQLYQKEAIESQLGMIERRLNLNGELFSLLP
ncbi:hypothetical protein HWI79_2132 [Cryptosporidium felis]|nr:hypothetical protein HWI79_2132 [Cryptosporidium felis]